MQPRLVNLLKPSEELSAPEQPPAIQWRVLYFFIGALTVFGIIWGAYKVTQLLTIKNFTNASAVTLYPKKRSGFFQTVKNFILHSEPVLNGEIDDRINILILGMGGPGHDGPYLTDTNIILSIKPSTHEVALISVPRDLGVKIPDYGWYKINHVNSFGELKNPGQGGELAQTVFSQTFNLPIPYYIRLDFKAFEEIINALGGIAVNVPHSFTDTQFPGPNNSYRTVTFNAGVQRMDGEQALTYARSRHGTNGEGSDFARSARQQLILLSLREKLLSMGTYLNPAVVQNIIESLSTHLATNLNFAELLYLANLARDIHGVSKTMVLDNAPDGYLISTTGESGAFILAPKTGSFDMINAGIATIFESSSSTPSDYSGLKPFLNAAAPPPPRPASSTLKIEIQNGTWRIGLASRVKQQLESKGFTVIGISNSLIRPITTTTIYTISAHTTTEAIIALRKTFPTELSNTLPEWLKIEYDRPETPEDERGMKYNGEADVLIILGNDYQE